MSDPTLTVDVEGVGPVTFRPLSEERYKELRRKARFQAELMSGLDEEATFRALVISDEVVISPRYSEAEFTRRFRGKQDLLDRVSDAVLARSWPNVRKP